MRRKMLHVLAAGALLPAWIAASPGDDYAARMHHEHAADTDAASPAAKLEPRQPVVGEEVVYGEIDGQPLRGYLARPERASGTLPGIVVVHEWWGLNDNVRAMARRWAGEGYVALAVDLYKGASATTPEEAQRLMKQSFENGAWLLENLAHARAWLAARDESARIGVVGWCYGGGMALETALDQGKGYAAAVVYYGRTVQDPEKLAGLEAPLLGLFGGQDRGIPVEGVRAMEGELQKLGKRVTIQIYPDANHAFANPTGQRYDEVAAADAWKRATDFFAENLKR